MTVLFPGHRPGTYPGGDVEGFLGLIYREAVRHHRPRAQPALRHERERPLAIGDDVALDADDGDLVTGHADRLERGALLRRQAGQGHGRADAREIDGQLDALPAIAACSRYAIRALH